MKRVWRAVERRNHHFAGQHFAFHSVACFHFFGKSSVRNGEGVGLFAKLLLVAVHLHAFGLALAGFEYDVILLRHVFSVSGRGSTPLPITIRGLAVGHYPHLRAAALHGQPLRAVADHQQTRADDMPGGG